MELSKKILKLIVSSPVGKQTILFEKNRETVTFGSSQKCRLPAHGIGIPLIAKFIEKDGEEIRLYLDKTLSGFLKIGREVINFETLVESGLLREEKERMVLPILSNYQGDGEIGDLVFHFSFEDSKPDLTEGVSIKFAGLFSIARLKSMGRTYFRSLAISFSVHFLLFAFIILVPRPHLAKMYEPIYRSAKVLLSPVKIKPARETEKAAPDKIKGKDDKRGTLLSMIDSKSRIKGFVQNLFYSKSDSLDIIKAQRGSSDSDGKGLFTNIEKVKDQVKKGTVKDVGPIFASIEGSSKLTKDIKKDILFESEIKSEAPEIDGTLNRDAISKTVAQGEGALRFCYEEALIRKSKISGRIVLVLNISPLGELETVEVESSSVDDKSLENCVIKKVKRWHFPKPEGGRAKIKYPFVFYTTQKG